MKEKKIILRFVFIQIIVGLLFFLPASSFAEVEDSAPNSTSTTTSTSSTVAGSNSTGSSNCVSTAVGSPNGQPPAGCQGSSGGSVVWPFGANEDKTTFRRIDQGWDFQGVNPQIIYAVAAGTVIKANKDPKGFGNFYPYEHLDTPIIIKSTKNKYTDVYYGHVHYADGTHGTPHNVLIAPWNRVKPGDPIAYTYPGPWPANWLEIGFGDNVPVAHGASGVTVQGLDMEEYLIGTRKVNP